MTKQRYDTIVVGGGIAGLTSAAYLAREKQSVLLIEKNNELGGLVSSFKRDGFHFEAGVRALESAGIILPMLEDLGIVFETVRSKVSVGIGDEVLQVEDLNSIGEYRNLLRRLYPDSEGEIDDFIKAMRKIMKHLDVLYGIENPVFKDLKKDRDYLFKKLLPWLPKFIFTVGKINRLNMPVEAYLEKIIKNNSLRDIISQHFFKGTPTFFALSYFSLYLDYFYPQGGVGKLADAMVDKILTYKGEIKPGTTIAKVRAQDRLIIDDKGVEYYYSNLVWAADLKTLYNIADLQNLESKIKLRIKETQKKICESHGSESVFSLFLEVDQPLSYFSNISNGHFFYTPSTKGLNNIHRSELTNLLNQWDHVKKADVIEWLNRFLELNTFEISIPGLKDATLVPENKTGVIISFLADYTLFKKTMDSGWYNDFTEEIEKIIIDVLSNSIYPKLKGSVIKKFSFTPISIRNRTGSTDGSIVGWTFEKPLPVIHKIQNSAKAVLTPIPSVFQAGQWAYSPAGVPMSILTGKLAADRIISMRK